MRRNQSWLVIITAGAVVLAPGVVWAAVGSFTSSTATAAVTGSSTYATGKGVYGRDTSTSASQHYGLYGAASGTGGVGVFGSGTKYGVYSSGPLGVASGKNLVCTRCVTTADLGVLPNVSVYNANGTNTTLTDSVETPISFASEAFDTANLHNTVTNKTRLTAPVKGIYSITANLGFDSNITGRRELYLYKGTTLVNTTGGVPLGNGATYLSISTLMAMNAGDYVEVHARQGSGGDLNVFGCSSPGACSQFTMSFVSPF